VKCVTAADTRSRRRRRSKA